MAGKFEPKDPVNLAPPRTTPLPLRSWQRPMGIVYDVTGNKAYQPGASYNVFAGKDASRALGKTSTKAEDVSPEWQDLPDKEKGVLNDWITFFSKRYNVVGRVAGATNTE
ncbi:progesterone binding protein [Colletotrichum tofieldiae]|nr:progesterone binding protein [Colletotrichum tofieldiae]